MVEDDPKMSTSAIAVQDEGSHTKVLKTLRQEQYYPHHFQRVQVLQPEGHPRRVAFCRINRNEYFTKLIVCADEIIFTRNGINNFHNNHVRVVENPFVVK